MAWSKQFWHSEDWMENQILSFDEIFLIRNWNRIAKRRLSLHRPSFQSVFTVMAKFEFWLKKITFVFPTAYYHISKTREASRVHLFDIITQYCVVISKSGVFRSRFHCNGKIPILIRKKRLFLTACYHISKTLEASRVHLISWHYILQTGCLLEQFQSTMTKFEF